MRSAFGIEHGGIAKGFGSNAGRLAQAAGKGNKYASVRLVAGNKGKEVGENLRQAHSISPTRWKMSAADRKAYRTRDIHHAITSTNPALRRKGYAASQSAVSARKGKEAGAAAAGTARRLIPVKKPRS